MSADVASMPLSRICGALAQQHGFTSVLIITVKGENLQVECGHFNWESHDQIERALVMALVQNAQEGEANAERSDDAS